MRYGCSWSTGSRECQVPRLVARFQVAVNCGFKGTRLPLAAPVLAHQGRPELPSAAGHNRHYAAAYPPFRRVAGTNSAS